jgi:hypothetical protein
LAGGARQEISIGDFFTSELHLLLFFSLVVCFGFGRLGEESSIALAFGAPTVGAIKREKAGVEFVKGATCSWAEKVVAVDGGFPLAIDGVEGAFAKGKGLRNKDGEVFLFRRDLADEDLDLVLFISVKRLKLFRLHPLSVDPK